MKHIIYLISLVLTLAGCITPHATPIPTYPRLKQIGPFEKFRTKGGKVLGWDANHLLEQMADNYFILKTINPDKMVKTHEIHLSNFENNIKDGNYYEWFDNKKKWKEGPYLNNEKSGVWKYYSFYPSLIHVSYCFNFLLPLFLLIK